MNIIMKRVFGSYRQQDGFTSFIPSPLNAPYQWKDPRITPLLADAMLALGELNAASQMVPDCDAFLRMYVTKEAVTSSRIEGTRINMDEALLPQEEISGERRNDWQEVRNAMDALQWAVQELERLPLSMRLLKGAHRILMQSARGQHKQPGDVRRSQNWIGGATPATARYVPPPAPDVPALLANLEKYWHDKDFAVPALIRAALSHYQFEAIHPFLDGNGRVGRLLITLHLIHVGLLSKPVLYLSAFLEAHRTDYFDALDRIRTHGDPDPWLILFLGGVADTAKSARETMRKIITLHQRYEDCIVSFFGKRTRTGLALLRHLFSRPTVRAADVMDMLGVSKPTANALVRRFTEENLLKEITGKKKNRLFTLQEYVALFRDA